jgi:hypothetical protein
MIDIAASPETVWQHSTNVQLGQFSDPLLFRFLGIPKPLRAELVSTGEGGERIAYFSSGKRFLQRITSWKPHREYAFDFNPEKGFRVGHLFDLSDGPFRIPGGAYRLELNETGTRLHLATTYSIHKIAAPLFYLPVRLVLKAFQHYLLRSIKKNSEA